MSLFGGRAHLSKPFRNNKKKLNSRLKSINVTSILSHNMLKSFHHATFVINIRVFELWKIDRDKIKPFPR